MMKHFSRLAHSVLLGVLLVSTSYAHAADSATTGTLNTAPIQNLSTSLIGILNTVVVPLVFALAFIVFLWGVFQAFILGAANEEKRKEGGKFVLWAVIGFVIMISIWGIVNLAVSALPTGDKTRPDLPCFDKDPSKCNK